MKKLLVSMTGALLMLLGTNAYAQLTLGDASWMAGGGFSTFSMAGSQAEKITNLGKKINNMPGFFFGASLDYAFSTIDGLTVEPGAYIYHFGKSYVFGVSEDKKEKSYHANYLGIPVNIKYAFPMNNPAFGLAVFTGPRFNLGLGGSMFSKGKTYPGLFPIEAQWGVGLAATIQEAFVLKVSYDTGLTKAVRDNNDLGFDDVKAHRNTVSVGAFFAF